MLKSLRNAFFTGLVVLAPLGVTLFVVSALIDNVGGRFRSSFFFFVPQELLANPRLSILWDILATLIVILVITLLGYFSRWFIGRFAINLTERILNRVPFINTVYRTVKQIVESFSTQQKAVFQKTVLIEYPRKGVWVLGFLTSTNKGETQAKTSSELCNVFVPTTPNPTSGFLLMIPKEEVIEMEMTITDGMKVIISGGAVTPPYQKNAVMIDNQSIDTLEPDSPKASN